jgi:hypothetical protein
MKRDHHKACPCPDCIERRGSSAGLLGLALILVSLSMLLFALLSGCASTTTPETHAPQQASWDGNEQNSGIIRYTPDGFLVTASFHDRYNELVAAYGKTYKPALQQDSGMRPAPDGLWLIDAEHLQRFVEMNLKRKSGIQTP